MRIAALLFLLATAPAAAQDKAILHTTPSGIGTYRIEIRGLDRFEVETVGDDHAVGELHAIEVTLHARQGVALVPAEQYHRVTERGPFLHNLSRDGADKFNTVEIRQGDIVQMRRRGDPQDYHLWIHDRRVPETDRILSMDFELAIRAWDLDCSADLVCNRGDNGWLRMGMHVVLPRARIRSTCGRSNTFPIQPIDGHPSVLGGNVLVVAAIDRFSDEATTDFQGLGPHLMPLNGEICIATSTDSDAWAR
ncbi:MAG: hypothetical protein AAF366_16925, partial [Pseudomonadota bacterium]